MEFKKIVSTLSLLLLFLTLAFSEEKVDEIRSFPNQAIFQKALNGYNQLKESGKLGDKNLITIIDYSLPSNAKRLWVIDVQENRVVLNCLVSHGRNSGETLASNFSNQPNSYQSSLGFFVTSEIYQGKHGMSLRLDGMEKNINHNARERAIVVHGADYVSESFIQKNGRLGRSQGCPAIPVELHSSLIELISDKTCLFIYAPDVNYSKSSTLAKN